MKRSSTSLRSPSAVALTMCTRTVWSRVEGASLPRAMQAGGPALGTTNPRVPHATISSYEGVVPKTVNWRTLGGGSEAPRERVA